MKLEVSKNTVSWLGVALLASIVFAPLGKMVYNEQTIPTNRQLRSELLKGVSNLEKVPPDQVHIQSVSGVTVERKYHITVAYRLADGSPKKQVFVADRAVFDDWWIEKPVR